jgi:hypothetical protein
VAKKRATTRRQTPAAGKRAAKKSARTKAATKKTRASRTPPADAIVRTLGDVARECGVSLHTVKKDWRPAWPKECGEAGAWNLTQIQLWRKIQQERSPACQQQLPMGDEAGDDWELILRKKRAETRIKEAEATKRERLNRLAEGAYVVREEVEAFLSEFLRACRDQHAMVAEEMGPEFPRAVRHQLKRSLQDRMAAVLRSLHTQARRLAELRDAA